MWSNSIIVCFPNEETARAYASAAGIDFPENGDIPTGNENYALVAPIQPPWLVEPVQIDHDHNIPGTLYPGYWAMLRLNTSWKGYSDLMNSLNESGFIREFDKPLFAWA